MKQLTKIIVFFVAFILLFYLYEIKIRQPNMVWMGLPVQVETNNQDWLRIFRNEAYLTGYSETKRNALWVSYKAIKKPTPSLYSKRPKKYKKDWRALNGNQSQDYKHTGYDRGHLAPNYLIGSRYGRKAQQETFLMSNISPQSPNLNRKLWQRLEELVSGYFLKNTEQLWVLTGPIYSGTTHYLKNTTTPIPSAFYKILVQPNKKLAQSKVLAFIMPQKVKGDESLLKFVTTVDKIEEATGLNFFSDLPDDIENSLEAQINTKPWHLKKVAHRASRY